MSENSMSENVLPMFSSKTFIVFDLTVRSLTHFGFIFTYGVRKYYNFILLHIADQFSKTADCLSSIVYFASFVKDKVSINVWFISGLFILLH